MKKLQQYLPFTVLKRSKFLCFDINHVYVATVPTACGMRRRVRDSREQSDDEVQILLT